jgi:hypothetical protein
MDFLGVEGRVQLKLKRSGLVVYETSGKNLIVDTGKIRLAELIKGDSVVDPSHFAMGDIGSTTLPTQTALLDVAELSIARVVATPSRSNNVLSYVGAFTNGGGSVTVREMGLFDQLALGGTMFSRFLPQEFTFANGDILDVIWTLTVGGII